VARKVSEVATTSEIDLSVLTALETRLGRSSIIGLIAAHLRHGKTVIERLESLQENLDRTELHAIGHQIVGSCGSIGLTTLSELGGLLEDEAPQAPIDVLQELIRLTLAACSQAQLVLAQRYPEVAA
jgi:HPt (histidine-containing phosphotransfer) domain-containing protein